MQPDLHVLLLTMHHIISDGWSIGVLIGELAAHYSALLSHNAALEQTPVSPELPSLPVQYADYALWQRAWLRDELLAEQLAYWTQQFEPLPTVLALPTDRPRPPIQTYHGAIREFQIGLPLLDSLKGLGHRQGATLFMTLLAAFKVLLQRWSGQADLVVGAPIAGRTHAELEPLIGFFVNTLALRTDLSGNPAFVELLRRVRDTTLGAYAHQDLPFELLLDALALERDLRHHPLFQVMFVLQNTPLPTLHLDDLLLEPVTFDPGIAKFDLTLNLSETATGLIGSFEYNTDLFDAATIARMAEQFQLLLASIVAAPEQPVGSLPLLPPDERRLLLDWSGPATTFAAECLHERFAAQVGRTPDAIAVTCGNDSLSYAELNARANQLAHHLRSLGVSGEICVGICVEPSVAVLVGLLGILKAGGAYVPLDPALPAERLQFMLHDSRSRVLLTQQHLLAVLPAYQGQTICLDRDWPEIARQPETQPAIHVEPEQLAYIIYTSGSTGVPKGVMIAQRGLASYLGWAVEVYRVAEGAGAPVHSSLGFDLTVTSLFTPLLCGRTVQLLPHGAHVEALASALDAAPAFSLVKATPAHLDLLRHMLDAHTLPRQARALVIGGEALRYDTLAFWRTHAPETRLINEYGPTEAVVGCCIYEVESGDPQDGLVPIGRPTAHTRIYILDAHGQLAPIGVAGEIYLGGVQLARGYLGRPDLTAERFIPDPFSSIPGSRLYRTGDLGRYRPDGTLDYLGRIDRQIKLRGYRVELGEIEAVLVQHPAVRKAAVVAHGERGETQLVAYVVENQEPRTKNPGGEQKNKGSKEQRTENKEQSSTADSPSPIAMGEGESRRLGGEGLTSTLLTFLQERLPSYMIPSEIMLLDALPLTPNGKLDQRALPAPSTARPELSSAFVAPRTPTEQTLAAIWQDVLGRDQVGIHDNFFALGGDSIRSIAVVTAAQAAGLSLTVQQIFQHQTIAALAPNAHAGRQAELPAPEPFSLISAADRERLPAGVEDAYPLTQLQLGMLFHSQYHPEESVYHNIFSYQLHGPYNLEAFVQAAQEVVDRHVALRTAFEMSGYEEPLQLVYRDVPVQVLTGDLRSLDEAAQEAFLDTWIDQEREHVIRWDEPPLARIYLHRRADERFQFSFSFHHAILDGWSVAMLLTELFQRYMARVEVTPIAVEPLQTSFRSFVGLELAARESIEQQAFWAQVLRNRPTLRLPLAATPQPYAGPHQILLAPELAEALRRLAVDLAVPLRSVLLTAHLAVLRLISGERRVLTGLVTNGRPETPDGERLLGLFLNSVPLQMTIDRRSWRELIRATFAVEQQMLPFRRYPLAQMQRDFDGQPLFEVLFNFVHFHAYQQLQQVPGLQAIDQRSFVKTNFALDVTFSVGVNGQTIGLELDYDVRLGAAQADRIVGFYFAMLAAIVEQPDRGYSAAALLSPSEHEQLLTGNQTSLAVPDEASIQHFFEAQVARTPEATALIWGTQRLTYQTLNQRSNQLAHALRERGIGPEVRVGVCLDRAADLVVALLAVLKAGGAYVPLDPAYPRERLRFMLDDAQAPLLLTQTSLIERVPAHDAAALCLDTDWPSIASQPTSNPPRTSTALNLAYLIYTSGSTGRPKGVAITHHSAAVLLAWAQQVYTPQQLAGVLASTSVCFDLSVFELFVPLSVGGAVILANTALDLPSLPAAQMVTLLNTVPSAAAELLRMDGLPASVQTVNLAGEPLPQSLALDLYGCGTVTQVLNLYGPSEDTTYSTWAAIPQPVTDAPTIGQPIANTQAYVLDAEMQPVPLGVAGELYLGGDGLARGYLGRPDLTAERFVPDPFGSIPGARLYRTGDLALRRADGQLEYIGRTDQQVKLRGFRIELGEIEAALRQHPAVRDAAVLLRDDTGTKRIVAYVVRENLEPRTKNLRNKGTNKQANKEQGSTDSPPSPVADEAEARRGVGKGESRRLGGEGLKSFLAERLPEYMVPGAFVELDALPLTINGKLDRRALPAPEQQRDEALVGPRDTIELRLVRLWEELLDTRPIGVHDSFFALGGDSLLAVRLIAQIQRQFDRQLPLAALFQARTIEQLGGLLRHGTMHESDVLVPIQPHGTQPPLFLVHPIGGNVLAYVELAQQLGSNQPLYGLQARGLSDPQRASSTIAEMAADYLAALRTIQPHGPYRLGGWSFGGVVAVEMARQLQDLGEQIAALLLIDSGLPTTTTEAPDDLALLAGFARDLGVTIESPAALAERFTTEDERFGALLEHAQRSGIVPPDLERPALQQLFAIFKTNLLALQRYTPQPYAGSITLFVAAEEPAGPTDPRLAWAELVDGLSVHEIPADHYTILKSPAVQLLAAELRRELERDLEADPVREPAS
ncbi:MAG TPA: amino acid adenylation domain-containing protein [Herpetosiphonaceae bacterium]